MPVEPDADEVPVLAAGRPAGIIAHIYTKRLAHALLALRKPLVNVSGVLPELPIPRVGVDDCRCGELAAAHLLERGFKCFGFAGHLNHAYSTRRESGFRRAVEAAGCQLQCYYERKRRQFDPMGQLWALDKDIHHWMRSLSKPVGLFAPNDIWGVQLTEVCRQTELRVPEDVAIVTVDNDDLLCDLARPSLSSVAVPCQRIGYEAAALLDRMLRGGRPSHAPILLRPSGVITRRSSDVLAMADEDLVTAVSFIREHAHQPLRVRDVLKKVFVSRRSLERKFRAILKRSVLAEIRRAHVELAKKLLLETDLPMQAIAARSGLSEAKQLSVIFRQLTGTTPTAHRRLYRNYAQI
jgi:LacI family transcriptional regulator